MREVHAEAEQEAVRLEEQAAKARTRAEVMRASIVNLAAFLGEDDADDVHDIVDQPSESPRTPAPKRVRSAQFLVNLLRDKDGGMTRAEIINAFEDAGMTDGMQNPANAIGTAILRAVKKDQIKMIGIDLYAHPEANY